jgi:serine/threonine-protein kinase
MQTNTALQLVPGTVVLGQYKIVRLLGVGSSGFVYLCHHLELADYPLAMKVLFNSTREQIDVDRFRSEIRSAYEVNDGNVIRIYEYICEEDFMAFTMEYLSGGNLNTKMRDDEFEEPLKTVATLMSICSGLIAIHKAGIVHRDLKPENVLINEAGQLKIADFSIALNDCGSGLDTNGVLGTIDYISPEYLGDGVVDARSDIYALGVIAYEMITGQIPCQGKNPYQTLRIRMENKPEPVSLFKPETHPLLERIVMKALEREPSKRYQTARDMLRDLTKLADILCKKTFLEKNKVQREIFETQEVPLTRCMRKFETRKEKNTFEQLKHSIALEALRKKKYYRRLEIFGLVSLVICFGAFIGYYSVFLLQ